MVSEEITKKINEKTQEEPGIRKLLNKIVELQSQGKNWANNAKEIIDKEAGK